MNTEFKSQPRPCHQRPKNIPRDSKDRIIGYELKGINNMIHRYLDRHFEQAGLDELHCMQGPLIHFLSEETKVREVFQKDIEEEFNIRRSTATGMLQNLEQKGYLKREPVPYDARMKRIVLTEKAIQQDQVIQSHIDAFHMQLEHGITLEEKTEFLRILDKIRKNIE